MTDQPQGHDDTAHLGDQDTSTRRLTRRHFLVVSAASGAGAAAMASGAVHAQAAAPQHGGPAGNDPHAGHGGMTMAQMQPGMAPAGATGTPLADGFMYFSPFQARIVNAAAGRF